MTIFLEEPRRVASPTFAGGVAPLGEIVGAGFDALRYVENSNAAWSAFERAYDDRIRAIHEATGAMLENPLRAAHDERRAARFAPPSPEQLAADPTGEDAFRAMAEERMRRFDAELAALGEKFPDSREAIAADRPIDEDAKRIAREADERLARLMDSRPGLGKWGALLAGGAAASFRDPVMVGSLVFGAGPGAARTIAGRLLTVAGKEALVNAAAEAAVQPMVQAWRERAGLDHGMEEAIRNVLFATVLGGMFGAAGQGAAEAIRPFVRPADTDRAAAALPAGRLSEPAAAILSGDGMRAASSLAEIRPALPAAARGALDEAERLHIADAQRPAPASPDFHDRTVALADRAVQHDIEAWPGFSPDPAQVERIAARIHGRPAAAPQGGEQSLVQFLKARGGVLDHAGELRAIGAGALSRKRGRKGAPDRRAPLDMAREAAEEAGYIGRAGETQTTTVADLLDAIEQEMRGTPVFPRGVETAAAIDGEAALARLEGIVAEVARHAGPAVDDVLIARAARMAVDEGLEPFDALERVLIADDTPQGRGGGRDGEPLPGWSDEELLAASATRGGEPVPDGVADPGRLRADEADPRLLDEFDADELIPGPDGTPISVAELRARLAHNDNLAAVVAACRV